MPETEAQLVKKMVAALRKKGCECSKIHGDPYQERGVPDILGCRKGKMFVIEAKRPGKEKNLSAYQRLKLKKYKKAGARVGVATTVEQALEIAGAK
jgi:Holliday junction resolvase